ncbi:UrvD/REP family ATP-dependent DNA helicase [Demequina mangrovi]|uniref:DNA 3'-5' helicase n=1 Tax=Demequina mangrovi TaxID=1043493 RepID=A0A1H6WZ01_9MICO|nr:UrvD/REP family ATP-dependent DNA helicase [Demequina mangrovi]SEJ19557.1 Superfamily I DNA or RNA helicase [Demequina mangrovi]
MTSLRLLPAPVAEPLPALDQAQRAAVDAALAARAPGSPGHLVVVGAVGAGKTTVAGAAALEAVDRGLDPSRLLVLAATRAGAARLRDRLSLAFDRPVGAPVVRTAASAAHAILTAQAAALGDPPPVLVTGAEQDQILRELLEGHRRGLGRVPDWGGALPPEATVLAGFRAELRDLLMRASEAGLTAEALAALGDRTGRPEWRAAADVMDEYDAILGWRAITPDQGARFDPAVVVAQAAHAWRTWEGPAERPAWDLVLVDDAQDLTAAGVDLLRALAEGGARLVLLGNADEAVQGYRGAVPAALADAAGPEGFDATVMRLGPGHRQEGALAAVASAAVSRIGTSGVGSARVPAPAPDGGDVQILLAAHRHAHSRAIAQALRRARHGLDGAEVPWGEMVVIARSSARLREIRADLAAADIPCETLGDGTALHLEPAVAPLLVLMRRAAERARGEEHPWEEAEVSALLGSRLIGIDPVAMRRLRRALVREERRGGGERASAELLTEAIEAPERWATVGTPEARLAERASRALAAGAEAAADGTPATVAWAVWDALRVADEWRAAALAGSARDDADLDAVIALVRAATLYVERMPSASVESFLDHLEGQDFAADTLGARGRIEDVVSFRTPASAAGREWEMAVVAGLEEGAWPDTRLRDAVLGAQHLAEILAGRAEAVPLEPRARAAWARAARRAVIDDETRAFAVAVSRARTRLVLTCVDGEDERPSRYLEWASAAAGVEAQRADTTPRVTDLRSAVAAVRAGAADAAGPAREAHVELLTRLAELGVAGADPREWHGVPEPSSEVGMWDAEQPVRVSPSRLEALETCPLRWALETTGGTAASSEKQSLGTLVHEVAAELPHGTHAELAAALEERWPQIAGTETWPDRVLKERADAMIRRLAGYVAGTRAAEVRVEQPFSVQIGRAVVAGSADRVEVSEGRARIVDLKTGTAVSKAAAEEHAQLAMYQLAAEHGGFRDVAGAEGASLVFVGGSTQGASERAQPSIDVDKERERLATAVDTMAKATFDAVTNDRCSSCPVRRSCPAWPSGRQVTDG